jgi:hypothetical protein
MMFSFSLPLSSKNIWLRTPNVCLFLCTRSGYRSQAHGEVQLCVYVCIYRQCQRLAARTCVDGDSAQAFLVERSDLSSESDNVINECFNAEGIIIGEGARTLKN